MSAHTRQKIEGLVLTDVMGSVSPCPSVTFDGVRYVFFQCARLLFCCQIVYVIDGRWIASNVLAELFVLGTVTFYDGTIFLS